MEITIGLVVTVVTALVPVFMIVWKGIFNLFGKLVDAIFKNKNSKPMFKEADKAEKDEALNSLMKAGREVMTSYSESKGKNNASKTTTAKSYKLNSSQTQKLKGKSTAKTYKKAR